MTVSNVRSHLASACADFWGKVDVWSSRFSPPVLSEVMNAEYGVGVGESRLEMRTFILMILASSLMRSSLMVHGQIVNMEGSCDKV